MGKKKTNKKSTTFPLVSVCTPTFNRRPFIETMFQCFRNQDYPKSRLEWIIIDDGTDKIEDLIEASNIPQIKYFKYDDKMYLGKKRNLMHEKSTGSIIVYMDDDDYYPPNRISHAVEMLRANPTALCAGSSIIHVYFEHLKKIIQFGPYGDKHSTAATFAFRRSLLDTTSYDDNAALAEEKHFLKNYSIPFVQLDPHKSILVFSHEHNSFDKRKLLENPNPKVVKETSLSVKDFVKEGDIRDFFLSQIKTLLPNYEPGNPDKKQDVIQQMKELQVKRDLAMKQQQENGPIMMHKEGSEPVPISNKQAVEIIMQKDQQLKQLVGAFKEKEDAVTELNEKYQKSVIENRNLNNKISLLEEKIELLTKLSENYENNTSTIST